jgi:hypothetical protein
MEQAGAAIAEGEFMNVIDAAIDATIAMMNALNPFASVTRGALPTGNGIVCEISPTSNAEIYLDKGARIPIDLTLNGKHKNLQTLSNTLNEIHDALTKIHDPAQYPSGTGWKIVDMWTSVYPRIIGRENDNKWIMASSLTVNLEKKGA